MFVPFHFTLPSSIADVASVRVLNTLMAHKYLSSLILLSIKYPLQLLSGVATPVTKIRVSGALMVEVSVDWFCLPSLFD